MGIESTTFRAYSCSLVPLRHHGLDLIGKIMELRFYRYQETTSCIIQIQRLVFHNSSVLHYKYQKYIQLHIVIS